MPTGTSGFGFEIPVFRMNQGVNASTANPMARGGAMQQAEPVMESQFGLNFDVMARAEDAARTKFYGGVNELNNFINTAAQFGIDPTKVDMSNPESFALNKQYRDMMSSLQQQAQAIRSGAIGQIAAENKKAQERAEEQYGWAKSNMEYNRDVVRPQAARDQLRQNLEYEEKQVDKKFERLIAPFYTQAKSLLNMDFNVVDSKNLAKINKRKEDLSKSLAEILKNPNLEDELKTRLTDFMSQINNVTPLQARVGGSVSGLEFLELEMAKQGLFTQKPTLKDDQGKEAEVNGFIITSDGKFKVNLKREKPKSAQTLGQPGDGDSTGYVDVPKVLDPNNPQDFRDINTIIQRGYGDGEDGKRAKAFLIDIVTKLKTPKNRSGSSASTQKSMAKGSK